MVEDDDAPCPALTLHQGFHFRVVDPADLVLVVEIGDPRVVTDKAEAVLFEREIDGVEPAVADRHPVLLGSAAAGALVGGAGRPHQGHRHSLGVDKIIESRVERFALGVEFGELNHRRLLHTLHAMIGSSMIDWPGDRHNKRQTRRGPPNQGETSPMPEPTDPDFDARNALQADRPRSAELGPGPAGDRPQRHDRRRRAERLRLCLRAAPGRDRQGRGDRPGRGRGAGRGLAECGADECAAHAEDPAGPGIRHRRL